MLNKKLVIFDLDGTLLYTLDDLTDSLNYALQKFNYPTKNIKQVRKMVGDGVSKLIERAIPDGDKNPNFADCLNIFKKHYKDNMYNTSCPYSEIITLLNEIKKRNIKIAVCSNKFNLATKHLVEKYFGSLVDYAQGEDEEHGIRRKPEIDEVLKILAVFNLKKDEAIFVGDSQVDINTAKNIKMSCVSVLWGYKDKDFLIKNGAEIIIEKPLELLNFI